MKIRIYNKRPHGSQITYLVISPKTHDDQMSDVLLFELYHLGRYMGELSIFKGIGAKVEWIRNTSRLQSQIIELTENTYSIGTDKSYYINLFETVKEGEQLLKALNDALYTNDVSELAEKDTYLKLLHDINQDHANIGRGMVVASRGGTPPRFTVNNIVFDFSQHFFGLNRIIALVGENGSGKTNTLYTIAHRFCDLKDAEVNRQVDRVLALSYCIFDRHDYPKFSYRFIGSGFISKNSTSGKSIRKVSNALRSILKQGRSDALLTSLRNCYAKYGPKYQRIIDFLEYSIEPSNRSQTVSINNFAKTVLEDMSAGQYYMFLMIIEIVANITYNSLLLIDEPENMTHPDMTLGIMSFYYYILDQFDSYAVISTHSAYILQNIPSKFVRVMNGHPLQIETFGENIVKISDAVFGYTQMYQFFRERLQYISKYVTKNELEKYFADPGFSLYNLIDAVYEGDK